MNSAAHLLFYRHVTGLSLAEMAARLGISSAYISLLMTGKRAAPAALAQRLRTAVEQLEAFSGLEALILQLEKHSQRALSDPEREVLAGQFQILGPFLQPLLARLNQREDESVPTLPEAEGDRFALSTALSGLTSIADILVEEPDLDQPTRAQFHGAIQEQAQRLSALITQQSGQSAADQPISQDPGAFVDQTFQSHGYYFEALEAEADLIVRRTRRHGPLGTFALVQRLAVDLGIEVAWQSGAGMAPSSVGQAALQRAQEAIHLDASLGEAQLRFRLAQYLAAREAEGLLSKLVAAASPPDAECARKLEAALLSYLAAAMFMPYADFLTAAQQQRYDIDWLSRHFACSFDQVCHRLIALRKPGESGVPFGMLRVSPAGHTLSRIPLPGLALPSLQAACPLWAAYVALQHPGETQTQLAEFPSGDRFLFVGRTAAGPRAHFGQPRRLTSVMLACDWAYADALIYADGHDPQRDASLTHVGATCETCPRAACENRVAAMRAFDL